MKKYSTAIAISLMFFIVCASFLPVVQANTYYWWDSVYFVGSGQYIKYPHPDRDYYTISPFSCWSIVGSRLSHFQIDRDSSITLARGGPSIIGAAIGATIGAVAGDGPGAIVGAVAGAVAGVVLGWVLAELWLDEQSCIWWWVSNAFLQWVLGNCWTIAALVALSPILAIEFMMGGFLVYGYLRVGSVTFYDAIARGNPSPPPPPPPGGGGGGGGCPTIFSWNGNEFVEESFLNIHSDSDVTLHYMLSFAEASGRIVHLKLKELDEFTSHIDCIKLYAIDSEFNRLESTLVTAQHSGLGSVTSELSSDDDTRVNLAPEENIRLEFLLPNDFKDVRWLVFEINGYNMKAVML